MLELLELYDKDITEINDKLHAFLTSCGVEVKDKNTFTMLKLLDDVVAVRADKRYLGLETKNGYIQSAVSIDGIVVNDGDYPDDLIRGYYKYEKGKYVLDEKKRQLMRGV